MGRGALLGIALVLALAGGAQARSLTTISIAVTTGNQPVGGVVYATFGSPATVGGAVDGGGAALPRGAATADASACSQRGRYELAGGWS